MFLRLIELIYLQHFARKKQLLLVANVLHVPGRLVYRMLSILTEMGAEGNWMPKLKRPADALYLVFRNSSNKVSKPVFPSMLLTNIKQDGSKAMH